MKQFLYIILFVLTGNISFAQLNNFSGTIVGRKSLQPVDAVINFTKTKYELGLTINNILNIKWKETQFDTETRLKNEAASVDEICFTPGTPFAAKLSVAIFFK